MKTARNENSTNHRLGDLMPFESKGLPDSSRASSRALPTPRSGRFTRILPRHIVNVFYGEWIRHRVPHSEIIYRTRNASICGCPASLTSVSDCFGRGNCNRRTVGCIAEATSSVTTPTPSSPGAPGPTAVLRNQQRARATLARMPVRKTTVVHARAAKRRPARVVVVLVTNCDKSAWKLASHPVVRVHLQTRTRSLPSGREHYTGRSCFAFPACAFCAGTSCLLCLSRRNFAIEWMRHYLRPRLDISCRQDIQGQKWKRRRFFYQSRFW
jgi:hypothetical protein